MWISYLKTAIRNIQKSPFYAILNILGLTTGLTAFIFILIYVNDELSYDKHYINHQNIYRIESEFEVSSKHDNFAVVPIPLGPALQLEYPEIKNIVRFDNVNNTTFRYGDKEYYEDRFFYTDSTVFDVFSHELLIGDLNKALVEPNSVVLTDRIAKKYFGNENPIGKVIESADGDQYKVTAVIKNLPLNTHLKYDALISMSTLSERVGAERYNSLEPIAFWNIGLYTYVELHENSTMSSIHEKFPEFYDKYMRPIGDQINASFNLHSTPLCDVHLHSDFGADEPSGNIAYVYIFSAIAIFMLILAAINYMNMATARSATRSREVGMRKVMGAEKPQLVFQFLSESLLMSFIALIMSIGIVYMFLPDFNALAGKDLYLSTLFDPVFLTAIILVTIIIGVFSGSYPAFYLSSFMPLNILKGTNSTSSKNTLLMRRILVVFQFFIAIVMIIATLVVRDQLNFLNKKDQGYNKENVVVLSLQDDQFREKAKVFREDLLLSPYIEKASNSTGVPGRIGWIQVMGVEQETEMKDLTVILNQSDYYFNDLMEFEFLEGRDFDINMGTDDSAAVIINETAARQFGWSGSALGKKIHYGYDENHQGGRIMKVIGVVKDFNFMSLHNKIEPIILFISPEPRYYMSVKVANGQLNKALTDIEEAWNRNGAKRPFDYKLLSQMQEDMYEGEQKINTIFSIVAILTVFIALLGLFGLSSFTTEQRTREIGIRKVNGATVFDILLLLYREFFILIVIAFVLAIPIAWWRLTIWLQSSFFYFTDIKISLMLLSGLIAIGVGLLTISYYVIKASSSNPVDALKYE